MKQLFTSILLFGAIAFEAVAIAGPLKLSRTATIQAASELAQAAYKVSYFNPRDYPNTSKHARNIGNIASRIEIAAREYQSPYLVLQEANKAVREYIYARPHIEEIWSHRDKTWIRNQLRWNLNNLLRVVGEPGVYRISSLNAESEPEEVFENTPFVWDDARGERDDIGRPQHPFPGRPQRGGDSGWNH